MMDPELAQWWIQAQSDVGEWAAKTFPQQTRSSIFANLRRELVELSNALVNGDRSDIGFECADMLILLFALCHREGIDLASCAKHTNLINRHFREWEATGADGR